MATQLKQKIPKGWKVATLNEVADKIGDGLHGTPEYSNNGEYFFINGNNIENGRIVLKNNTNRVDKEEFKKYKKDLGKNTILLSINWTIGNLAKYQNEKCILGKSVAYINVKDKHSRNFVYYLMLDSRFQKDIAENANGSTIKNVSLAQLRNYNFALPHLQEQCAIAAVLSSVDDKIEFLREQNKIIESTTQAIFKEWFIKFNFPGSAGKMIGSELGEIPKGWKLEKLTKMFNFIKGVEPGSNNYALRKLSEEHVPFYRVQDIAKYGNVANVFVDKNFLSGKLFDAEDILISLDGTIGRVYMGGSGGYSSGIRKVVASNDYISKSFIFAFLKSEKFQNDLDSFSGAETTIKHAGGAVEDIVFALDEGLCKKFGETTGSLFQKLILNISQIQTLLALRNSLLPKLIRGEVRVESFSKKT